MHDMTHSQTSHGWTSADANQHASNHHHNQHHRTGAQVFSDLPRDDQARLVNLIFSELRSAYPGQYLKYSREINDWEVTERKRLVRDEDFRRLTAVQIKEGLAKSCRLEFLPTIGKFIQNCIPSLQSLGLPDAEQAWQEASNHSHEVVQHKWSHWAVYEAGKRTGWHTIRSAYGDHVTGIKRTFTDVYTKLSFMIARGLDSSIKRPLAIDDMSKQSESEKSIQHSKFLMSQELEKKGIPQRMSGSEALKRMKAML